MHKTLHGQISKKFSGLENYFSVSCVSYIEAIHIKLFAKSFNSEGNLFLVSIQNVPLNNFFQVQWVFKKCLKFSYSICFKSNFFDQFYWTHLILIFILNVRLPIYNNNLTQIGLITIRVLNNIHNIILLKTFIVKVFFLSTVF